MKGYIQGIESENLGQQYEKEKTILWYATIPEIKLENGICEFSFKWDTRTYIVKAKTNNDFNYTGTIYYQDFVPDDISFSHNKNKNRNLLIGNWMEGGVDFRIIIEVS